MDRFLEFAGNHTLLVSALAVSFFVLVFTELRRKASGMLSVEPQEAVKLINADAAVIDLRNAEAFSRGHIVSAKNIPFEELAAHQEKLDRLKGSSIIAVCDAGVTSTKLADRLRKSGVENVYSLRGGMNAWTQASLPVVGGKKSGKKK